MAKYAVGLMSGTSLDGVDAALVKIEEDYKMTLIAFETLEIPEKLINKIHRALDVDQSSNKLLCSLNFELGHIFASAVKAVCKNTIEMDQLDFIASHGQTIYHIPKNEEDYVASTMQLGEAAVIAYETGVKVISNFRSMDMAAGGEGAPLVPYFDQQYFASETKNKCLLNIGGIANITLLKSNGDISAFDTGPGNMIINGLMMHYYNLPYDADGLIGKIGHVNNLLLNELMKDKYINRMPPKSTGREIYGQKFIENLILLELSKEDLIATVTKFTTDAIIYNIKLMNIEIDELIVSGGGIHNKTIMLYLKEAFPNRVYSTLEKGLDPDAKEAMAFVLLAYETLHRKPSNVPQATGASKAVILGSITIP